jgi:hypothetical protein
MSSSTHDKMIEAFQNYFKWHNRFEYEDSNEAGIKARNFLSEIRNQASQRRVEIQEKRKQREKTRIKKNGRPKKITS